MNSGIKVIAPASLSNLACGFDALGVALHVTADEMTGRLTDHKGVTISSITGHKNDIPSDPEKNMAGIAANALLNYLGEKDRGIELKIRKHIPGGSGLGSSAASACAAVVLVNELLNKPLEKRELVPFALEGECHASGHRHGDNVVPCLLGGMMLVRDIDTNDFHRVITPPGLHWAVVLPSITIATKEARSILRPDVPLLSASKQAANLGSLMIAMMTSDFELIGRSMQDHLVEEQRQHLIPYYIELKSMVSEMDALACSISGAGPAVFALCTERLQSEEIAAAMVSFYGKKGINARGFSGSTNHEGTVLM